MRNLLLLTLLSFVLNACGETITGNGKVISKNHEVEAFERMSTSGVFEVVLIHGEPKVVIETDENIHEHILVEVKSGELIISSENKMLNTDDLIVTVYYETMTAVSLSGASTVKTSGTLKAGKFDLDISGAAEADMAVDVDEFELDLSGGGEVKLKGRADHLILELSGAAEVDAFDLASKTADIDISGASEVEMSVSDELNVDISGAGEVKYKGSPSINQDISGAGELKQIK